LFAIARDITDRKITEDQLKESEERYRITLMTMPDAVSIMRCSDFQYLYVNDTFCRVMGYSREDLVGKTPYDLGLPVSEEDRNNLRECITDKSGTVGQTFKFRKRDGVILDTVTSCSPVMYGGQESMIVVVTDVTPLKRAEEEAKLLEIQLAQAQKMEALGTLAGGIAHDFNNILAAIIGYTELAMYQSKSQEKVHKNLSQVLKSSKRARDLVSQILAFSRQGEKKYTPLMLGYAIKETLKMLRSVLPANIEIRQNLMTPGLVLADATQIHQMMMNLCSNAVQAMGENGGVLEVNLEQVTLDEPTARGLDLHPGPYQRLTVSDTGHGMTSDLMARIFEPYFTTREVGKGTGLGLSIVHGIVIRHRGAITCRSEPGKGTIFEVYLPEIESRMGTGEPVEEPEMPGGHESILFIDDEPALNEIAKNILERLGYRVTSTARSSEALDLFIAYPSRFDLVVTDMTMPDITGAKLAKKLLSIRKDIPIILCTGYSEHITEEKARKIGIRKMLMKPLEIKELAHTIRKVLDQH
jgi:PAS domain S-box-containing protein